jgi:hypothetical protein
LDERHKHAFRSCDAIVQAQRNKQHHRAKWGFKGHVDDHSAVNTKGHHPFTIAVEPALKNVNKPLPGMTGDEMPASRATAFRTEGTEGKRLDLSITRHDRSCPVKLPDVLGVDFVGINPALDIVKKNARLVKRSVEDVVVQPGTAATIAEAVKKAKYGEFVNVDDGTFMALGFEVYGALGQNFKKLTGLVAKVLCHNSAVHSTYRFYGRIPITAASQTAYLLRQRIALEIMRGNAMLHEQYAYRCLPIHGLDGVEQQRNSGPVGAG